MTITAQDGLARREVLGGAALLALVLGRPGLVLAAVPAPALQRVCALVIPQTDTPGAGQLGVAEFVVLAAAHGLEGATPDTLPAFHALIGADFASLPEARQVALLTELDRAAFAPGAAPGPWRTVKALILTGYYTSEVGASRELQYELVPGRFDADLPLHPGDRAWSSDWTAVDFG
jgi:hypothetical protein